MKLIARTDSEFTFVIGKRERELLFSLLKRYPVLGSGHFRSPRRDGEAEPDKNQELIEEALVETQRDNRKHLEEMLSQTGRFKENDRGFSFTLSPSELEWMLQVLNDIRVGSWVELGQPDVNARDLPELSEKNIQLAWALEMAGLFEHSLVEAANS